MPPPVPGKTNLRSRDGGEIHFHGSPLHGSCRFRDRVWQNGGEVDKTTRSGYTRNRKGAAGRRSAPYMITEVTVKLWGLGRLLLIFGLQKQAANADDNQTKL